MRVLMFVLSGRRKGQIRRNRAYISMSLLALISDVQRFINSVGIPFHTLFSRPHLSFAREQRVRRADCKMIYSVFQLCYLNAFEPITFGKCDCSLLYYGVVFVSYSVLVLEYGFYKRKRSNLKATYLDLGHTTPIIV